MLTYIKHPEYYQGRRKKYNYFEGWYYKLVSKDQSYTIALIPGISLNMRDPHVFIQAFISEKKDQHPTLQTYYFKYPIASFQTFENPFRLVIDQNNFSLGEVNIHLVNDDVDISGTFQLSQLTPLKTSFYQPNIMGPFAYLKFMECYHGVISMHHYIQGKLNINQKNIDFDSGIGYIEKDWGKSFPSGYVWLQSNHFKSLNTSFMFSYADIPFLGLTFKGLIVNLVIAGKEYRFATYNFSKVKLEKIQEHHVLYHIKKGSLRLEVEATSSSEIALASPKNGEMSEHIKEGLSGEIHIKLYHKQQLIYEDIGLNAGIEIMKR